MGEQQLRLAMKATRNGTPDLWWAGSPGGWVYDKALRLVFSSYKDAFCCVDFGKLPRDSKPTPVPIVSKRKGWQPASEPPKHGNRVLVRLPSGKMDVTWHDRVWVNCFGNSVTHWRELPAGPKSEDGRI